MLVIVHKKGQRGVKSCNSFVRKQNAENVGRPLIFLHNRNLSHLVMHQDKPEHFWG